ncbi:MAG TPA: hypothetical protein VF021_00735 [Longimicrobiales bacterium]
MSFYDSRSRVEKVAGTHRRIMLATGESFDTGVHGAIKAHYKLFDEKDLPLPVDYIVGATGA